MIDPYAQLLQDKQDLEYEKTAGYIFSADDLRMVTDWSEQVIEDYLTKTRNLGFLNSVDQDVIDAIFDLRTRVEALEDQIAWLTPVSAVTSSNITLSGNVYLYCNNARPNAIIVTLNAIPRDAERVWITRGGYKVSISGNGKLINGESQINMMRTNETRALEFNGQLDQWVIV